MDASGVFKRTDGAGRRPVSLDARVFHAVIC